MKTDFPIASKEWTRWTNVTSRNNNDSVSLTQVISTYFAEQSVGDLGDEDSQYVPKAGYMGTLAPGEKFDEQFPIDKLPKRVLHPWPALQEVPFHVRWPPSHPMIPSPLLWIALNNMYTEVLLYIVYLYPVIVSFWVTLQYCNCVLFTVVMSLPLLKLYGYYA